jgi:hypothetical protein
MLCSKYSIP